MRNCFSWWIPAKGTHIQGHVENIRTFHAAFIFLLYKHFRLPGHSVAADMKVQILEKIYHSSGNPENIQLHRELHLIKELGTAAHMAAITK